MTRVLINPGAGPVAGGTSEAALASVVELFREADIKIDRIAYQGVEPDGRFAFTITAPSGRKILISMPGQDPTTLRAHAAHLRGRQ